MTRWRERAIRYEAALCVIEGMAAHIVEPRRVRLEILSEIVRVLGKAPK